MNENDQNCRVLYDFGPGWPVSFRIAMLILNLFPFAALECWNGHSWEVIWNGAVEFDGVAPEIA